MRGLLSMAKDHVFAILIAIFVVAISFPAAVYVYQNAPEWQVPSIVLSLGLGAPFAAR